MKKYSLYRCPACKTPVLPKHFPQHLLKSSDPRCQQLGHNQLNQELSSGDESTTDAETDHPEPIQQHRSSEPAIHCPGEPRMSPMAPERFIVDPVGDRFGDYTDLDDPPMEAVEVRTYSTSFYVGS
jgi:hypothetical protein